MRISAGQPAVITPPQPISLTKQQLWSCVFHGYCVNWLPADNNDLSINDITPLSPWPASRIAQCIAAYLGFPYMSLARQHTLALNHHQSKNLQHSVLLASTSTQCLIAISDPSQLLDALSYWQTQATLSIRCVCISEEERLSFSYKQEKRYWTKQLPNTNISASIIPQLAYFCCHYAYHARATDLHLLSQPNHYQLIQRIDGLREQLLTLPIHIGERLLRHWMIRAKLDYTQRQQAQDGTLTITAQNTAYRLRVNVCPSDEGMSLAIRLPRKHNQYTIESLQLEPEQEKMLRHCLKQKQGLLIVTGPTGSGKTQSLYCFLQHLVNAENHVVTLEDPVEHQLPGVTQIPVNTDNTLSYRQAISNTLRQDPDVIMIGEIRDKETAAMALQAAQTGHLVLASCHTNHTLATCDRLKQLGFFLADCRQLSITLLSQRLIRCYCPYCHHSSCLHCQEGYRGRRAVFECLQLTTKLMDAMETQAPLAQLRSIAESQGTVWLYEHAKRLIQRSITSQEECERVLGSLWGENHAE